jgi:N,N'-diacetyllegionaminate synthase
MNYFEKLKQCYLIAEIGVNHNGDMELARKMIDAAKQSGADAVKFQTFTAETLVSQGTPKVSYQESMTSPEESHYEMIRKLELKWEAHAPLKEYCEKQGLTFISTPYDVDSARFLHEELDIVTFKTASADIVDLPLQRFIASTCKPVMVSVGMATIGEVETVAEVYRQAANTNMVLLHCVSNYPCADESLNLTVMNTLRQAFQVPVGYSDHSVGTEAATLSIALEAKVIEKHFTLDKELPGPDHRASSTPEEFKLLVQAVRRAERMLGCPIKQCQEEEQQMSQVSRKSLHLAKKIRAGEEISEEDLVMKRPGIGLPINQLQKLVGRTAVKDLEKGHQINYYDLR